MLEELIKNKKLYRYEFDGVAGIVIADSKEEAKSKFMDAYMKHGYSEDELLDVSFTLITEGWFQDAPDVLEIF